MRLIQEIEVQPLQPQTLERWMFTRGWSLHKGRNGFEYYRHENVQGFTVLIARDFPDQEIITAAARFYGVPPLEIYQDMRNFEGMI